MKQMKCCPRCKIDQEVSNFYFSAGKPKAYCKKCSITSVVEWQRKNKERYNARKLAWLNRNYPDRPRRKPPASKEERIISRNKSRRKWLANNLDKMDAARKQWVLNNPHKMKEKTRRYQVAKSRAVPSWANKELMERIYKRATYLSDISGDKYEVDHIVPIKSKYVCGLHCEANLQILKMRDNRSKSNKFLEIQNELINV